MMWLLLACTEPSVDKGPGVPANVGAGGAGGVARGGGAAGAGDAAVKAEAARAAPVRGSVYAGQWRVTVAAKDPADAGAQALAVGLGVPLSTWDGQRPTPPPGLAAVLWVPSGADVQALGRSLGSVSGPPVEEGEVVLVLGGGDPGWAKQAAAELPWTGAGIVDAAAEAALWGASPDVTVGARAAASVIAEHYRGLSYVPAKVSAPSALATWLGPADPAATTSSDAATRTATALRWGADALAKDPEVAVRLAVATKTQDPAVLAALTTDPEPLVRARAADRLDDVARLALLAKDTSSVVRLVATDRLARAAPSPARDAALREAATSPDAYQRWKAAWGLTTAADSEALRISLLADKDIDVVRQAAKSLGETRSRAAVPALTALLSAKNSFVRRWAAAALGRIGDPAAVPALRLAATDPTLLVAMAAAEALALLGAPTQVQPFQPKRPTTDAALQAMAASADATDRKDVCKFLAGREDGVPILQSLAADPDGEVRKGVAEALGWMSSPSATLMTLAADPDPDVRITALESIARVKGGDAALAAHLTATDAEERLRAAEALAVRCDAGLAAVVADPDERVRAAAIGCFPAQLDPQETSILVRMAGKGAGDAMLTGDPGWIAGVIAREDALLHLRFSWNEDRDRPSAYRALRPPLLRPYGHPNRG